MSRNAKALTIHHAQTHQPWTVPYSGGVQYAAGPQGGVPHILGSHTVLHAAKSLGKLATVFERLDHAEGGMLPPEEAYEAKLTIRAMAADLVTAALRLGNLYKFSVAEALVERVKDKNDVDIIEWPAQGDAKELAAAAVSAMTPAHVLVDEMRGKGRAFSRVYDGHLIGNAALFNKTPVEDYMPKSDDVHPVSECAARGCTCCEEPDVARMARLSPGLTEEQRQAAMEGGSALYGTTNEHHFRRARLRPSGANGMQEGDLLEDGTDGFRGDASDFTQDGDVTLTSGTGIHRVQRITKWARCKLVSVKRDRFHNLDGSRKVPDTVTVEGDEHTAYDEGYASPVAIARAALEGKPQPAGRWPHETAASRDSDHLQHDHPAVDVHSVDQSIPKGFACFPGDTRACGEQPDVMEATVREHFVPRALDVYKL